MGLQVPDPVTPREPAPTVPDPQRPPQRRGDLPGLATQPQLLTGDRRIDQRHQRRITRDPPRRAPVHPRAVLDPAHRQSGSIRCPGQHRRRRRAAPAGAGHHRNCPPHRRPARCAPPPSTHPPPNPRLATGRTRRAGDIRPDEVDAGLVPGRRRQDRTLVRGQPRGQHQHPVLVEEPPRPPPQLLSPGRSRRPCGTPRTNRSNCAAVCTSACSSNVASGTRSATLVTARTFEYDNRPGRERRIQQRQPGQRRRHPHVLPGRARRHRTRPRQPMRTRLHPPLRPPLPPVELRDQPQPRPRRRRQPPRQRTDLRLQILQRQQHPADPPASPALPAARMQVGVEQPAGNAAAGRSATSTTDHHHHRHRRRHRRRRSPGNPSSAIP